MKYLCACLSLFCLGMTPVSNNYKDVNEVYKEFKNIFDNAQDQSLTVLSDTPPYQNMRDGAMAVYISTWAAQDIRLMLRVGTTIYASPMFPIMKGR